MDKEWMDSEEELGAETVEQHGSEDSDDGVDGLEINAAVISDTLRRLCEKSKKHSLSNQDIADYLEELGSAAKRFVLDNLTTIDYRDLAMLIGMKADTLKTALGILGIAVPVPSAKRWSEVDVGTFESLDVCSKCPVQTEHSTFSVGIKDCRKCYEENIAYWIEESETVNIVFG